MRSSIANMRRALASHGLDVHCRTMHSIESANYQIVGEQRYFDAEIIHELFDPEAIRHATTQGTSRSLGTQPVAALESPRKF